MTPEQIAAVSTLLAWLKDAGLLGASIMFIRMLLSGEIVTRREHNEIIRRLELELKKTEAREAEWRRLARRGTDIIEPLATTVREQLGNPKDATP